MSSSPSARRSRPGLIWIVALVVAFVAVAALYVTGIGAKFVAGLYPPEAVTDQGADVRSLYNIVFLIAAAIFLLVEGLLIFTIIAYRRKPTDTELPPQTHGNSIAEIIWTVIPTLIVVFLFIISWQTLAKVDTVTANAETKIRAVAGQFQWEFDYMPPTFDPLAKDPVPPLYVEYAPTGDEGGLHIPAGRTIQLYLNSPDVIHAFYVPQFLFKRDVVPGRTNAFSFNISADQAGQTFRGQCAELCGIGHKDMLFDVHAMTEADFDAWLAGKVAAGERHPAPGPVGRPVRWPGPERRPGRPRHRARRDGPERRLHHDRALGAGEQPDHHQVRQPGRGHAAQHQDLQGQHRGAGRVRGQDLPGRRDGDVPGGSAGRGHVPVRVLRPSEHDRHSHGPVGEPRWQRPR